jgi:hypothetical protein
VKAHPFLILSGVLLSFGIPRVTCGEDLLQIGNIVINPASAPAQLSFAFGAPGTAPGWSMGYLEGSPLSGGSGPLSVGVFRLHQPTGIYQWQFSEGADGRLAMELKNGHNLVLDSSDSADHLPDATHADRDTNTIELRPGPTGGLYLNGVALASSAETNLGSSLTVGGGTLAWGDYPVPYYWAWNTSTPGLLSVGRDARAFGDQAVAVGESSRAGFHCIVLGDHSVAQNGAVALGAYSTAFNQGTAIGGGHAEAPGATAVGPSSYASASCATAVGASSYAGAGYSAGIGGWANASGSWSGAWGTTWGQDSIALGGYAGASKSFAASSGVTYGDYSVAIGRGTVSWQHYTTVFGTLNADTSPANIAPNATDPLFVIGNGWVAHDNAPDYSEHRSNAFMVGHDGAAWVQAGLTVEGTAISHDTDGNPTVQPAASLFKGNVSVQGVLRVPETGDLSMGGFAAGPQP